MEHPYGYIKDNKVFLKGFLNQADRVIGEVKEDEASTLKYFENRFATIEEKVENLKKDIEENQNKGSFLMKLIHLKDSLMHYDALGNFIPLIEELSNLEIYLEEIIQKNRERNLEIKRGLILEAEALQDNTDWRETTEEYKNLKLRWIKTGPVEKVLEDEIERDFNQAIDLFFDNRKLFFEEMAVQAEENIKIYEDLVRQAREAYNNPDYKKAFEISKKIQKEWKISGKVPAEKRQPLWDDFSKLNNRIFSRFKREMQSQPSLNPVEVISKMESFVEEMKKLASMDTTPMTVSQARKLQNEWKPLIQTRPRDATLITRNFIYYSEIVFEKSFLNKLAITKNPDLRDLTEAEQSKIKAAILKDLIHRDESELKIVKENAENFKSNEPDFEIMIRRKISAHRRKIDVKNFILKQLSNKY